MDRAAERSAGSQPTGPTDRVNPPPAIPGPGSSISSLPPSLPPAPTAPSFPMPSDPSASGAPAGPSAGPAGRPPPAPLGIPACDEYARLACSCPDSAVRDPQCDAAHDSVEAWRRSLPASRQSLESICPRLRDSARQLCPQRTDQDIPTLGVPSCDAYAQRVCTCSSTLVRGPLCDSTRRRFQDYRASIAAGTTSRSQADAECAARLRSISSVCL
ncbi:MAG: hypothetical protein IT379_31755 [Deltaproteobacteria bacterium]|nr:hypothetical protein [Deltaproteobacteria bacterium]